MVVVVVRLVKVSVYDDGEKTEKLDGNDDGGSLRVVKNVHNENCFDKSRLEMGESMEGKAVEVPLDAMVVEFSWKYSL